MVLGRHKRAHNNAFVLPLCRKLRLGPRRGAGTYEYYDNTNKCLTEKVTLHIKGKLSKDPVTPGLLHETAVILNKTVGPLLPNYIFAVHRDSKGAITTAFSCTSAQLEPCTSVCALLDWLGRVLGWQMPACGQNFARRGRGALQLQRALSLAQELAHCHSRARLCMANKTTSGQLDVSGMRYNDEVAYAACASS